MLRYFDEISSSYAAEYDAPTRDGYFYRRRRELVTDELTRYDSGLELLDVGCGPGVLRGLCTELGYHYTGIDGSTGMVAAARKAASDHPDAVFAVGRVEHLDVPSESVDVVMSLGVLEYVEPSNLPTAVNELARVAKPGGTLILSVLSSWSPVWAFGSTRRWMKRVITRARHRKNVACESSRHVNRYSGRRVRTLVDHAGARVTRCSGFAFSAVPASIFAWRPQLCTAVSSRLERLGDTPLRVLAMANFVVATKPARPE